MGDDDEQRHAYEYAAKHIFGDQDEKLRAMRNLQKINEVSPGLIDKAEFAKMVDKYLTGKPNAQYYGSSEPSLEQQLAIRLKWPVHQPFPLNYVVAAPVKDNKIAIFFVFKETPVVIEDDAELYPSDALVTQIRMLTGKPPADDRVAKATLSQAVMRAPAVALPQGGSLGMLGWPDPHGGILGKTYI